MSHDTDDYKPDPSCLFPAPDGSYRAQCTEVMFLHTKKDGWPAFKCSLELTAGVAGTADPPELASVEEWFTFPPRSGQTKDVQKRYKQNVIQLQKWSRATGRAMPQCGFGDEDIPVWEEFFKGAELELRLETSQDGARQWNRY